MSDLPRGRQIQDEDHPCQCHDSYIECEDEETVHVKRDYYEQAFVENVYS